MQNIHQCLKVPRIYLSNQDEEEEKKKKTKGQKRNFKAFVLKKT